MEFSPKLPPIASNSSFSIYTFFSPSLTFSGALFSPENLRRFTFPVPGVADDALVIYQSPASFLSTPLGIRDILPPEYGAGAHPHAPEPFSTKLIPDGGASTSMSPEPREYAT